MVAGTIERKSGVDDVWSRLAAPIDRDEIQWRIDGKSTKRDGKFFARQVAWADVPVVVRRLDSVVPGEWSFTAEVIGPTTTRDKEAGVAIKGRLTIRGVTREDVGVDTDEKAALTDAIKRTARLFGIALELWEFPQSWVEVDSDGKYAKIVGDSWEAHDRALARRDGTPAPRAANGNGARKKTAPRSADLPALPEWPALDNGTDRESSVGQAARIKQLIEAGDVPEQVQTEIRKSLVAHPGDLENMGRIIAALEKQYFRAPSNREVKGNGMQEVRSGNDGTGSHMHASGENPPQGAAAGAVLDMDRVDQRQVRRGATEEGAEGVRAPSGLRDDVGAAQAGDGSGSQVRHPAVREAVAPVRNDAGGEPGGHGRKGKSEGGPLPVCPKCGGRVWDNRIGKRNPKAPDFKCRDRSCGGVIWPPKEKQREPDTIAVDGKPEYAEEDDEIPF